MTKPRKPIEAPEGPWKPGKRAGVQEILIPAKEAKVIEGIVEGKKPAQAVEEAGYCFTGRNAKVFGESIKKKYFDANGALLVSLESVGIDPGYIANKVKGLCEAKKQLPVRKTKVKSEGTETEEIEYAEFEDHHAQHKGINTLLDILPGARAPKRVEVTQQSFEQKVSIHAEISQNPAEAMHIIQKLIEQKKTVEQS